MKLALIFCLLAILRSATGFFNIFPKLSSGALMNSRAAVPGSPVIENMDEKKGMATIKLALDMRTVRKRLIEATKVISRDCVKEKRVIKGFIPGEVAPITQIINCLGCAVVESYLKHFLIPDIEEQCKNCSLSISPNSINVTEIDIREFRNNSFGNHTFPVTVQVDLLPLVVYKSNINRYKKLKIEIPSFDESLREEKHIKEKENLLNKFKSFQDVKIEEYGNYSISKGDKVCFQAIEMSGKKKHGIKSKNATVVETSSNEVKQEAPLYINVELDPLLCLPALYDSFQGMKIGDSDIVVLKEDEEGFFARMKATPGRWNFTVVNASMKIIPSWSDKFAQEFNSSWKLKDLEAAIEKKVEYQIAYETKQKTYDIISDKLLEICTVPQINQEMAEKEILIRFQGFLSNFQQSSKPSSISNDPEVLKAHRYYRDFEREVRPNVEKLLKLNYLLQDIAIREHISMEPSEFQEGLASPELHERFQALCKEAILTGRPLPSRENFNNEIMQEWVQNRVFDRVLEYAEVTYTPAKQSNSKPAKQ